VSCFQQKIVVTGDHLTAQKLLWVNEELMPQTRSSVLAAVVFVLAFPLLVSAGSIGVNFTGGNSGATVGSTDQPGIAPGANWNNFASAGTGYALNDDSGSLTTATLSFSGPGYAGFPYPVTPNTATNAMYSGGLYDGGGQWGVSVSNIPYAAYNVYVYTSTADASSSVSWVSDGATTYYYQGNGADYPGADGLPMPTVTSLVQTTSTDPLNPTFGMSQYQIFSGETGSTFTLTNGVGESNVFSNNIFGLQIVDASGSASPEPASFLLIAGGLGAMLAARRVIRAR
jgi:hypothetical protein